MTVGRAFKRWAETSGEAVIGEYFERGRAVHPAPQWPADVTVDTPRRTPPRG